MNKLPILKAALEQFVGRDSGDMMRAMLDQPASYWNVTKPTKDGIPDYRHIAIMLHYSPTARILLLTSEELQQFHELTVKARSKFVELKNQQNETGRKLLGLLQEMS